MAGGNLTSMIWFRNGLRVHDNPALLTAASSAESLLPVFVWDSRFALAPGDRASPNRYRFLLESLTDLDSSLKRLCKPGSRSRLLVVQGDPCEVLPDLWKRFNVRFVYFEKDTEPMNVERDVKILSLAKEQRIEVHSFTSRTLYDPWVVAPDGHPPLTYQSFLTRIQNLPSPPDPVPIPESIPGLPTSQSPLLQDEFTIPSLKELGIDDSLCSSHHQGGETVALARMEMYCANEDQVRSFEKPKTSPAAFNPPDTTVLSPYIRYGCLSSRTFYQRLLEIYRKKPRGCSKPPVSLEGQLLWREFYYTHAALIPNYDRMKDNPICAQIPWITGSEAEKLFKAWEQAQTGYPWIDAIMTQLRTQGWIHHLARHSVACFLTRGDLFVHWEKGREVFEELLLDADWSLNAGNWMWLSASAYFHQYYRVYSPVAFAKKWDADGQYIKHFIPALRNIPKEYIFEPWKAPRLIQEEANCIIGKDYPYPICKHEEVYKKNIEKMKQAYAAKRDLQASDSSDKRNKRQRKDA